MIAYDPLCLGIYASTLYESAGTELSFVFKVIKLTVLIYSCLSRMRIPLPPPDAPLSTLRAAIQERTGVAPEHQKLIVGGAIMQKGKRRISMQMCRGSQTNICSLPLGETESRCTERLTTQDLRTR